MDILQELLKYIVAGVLGLGIAAIGWLALFAALILLRAAIRESTGDDNA